jgi:NAD-dependent protein deacetylase/lipoamidase
LRAETRSGIIPAVGDHEEKIDAVVSFLRGARSVLYVTGAGISADSGLPTYRGIGGLYEDADTPEGIPIEEALSGEMMRSNPSITWKYIHQIEASSRGASFNRAHSVVAESEGRFERVWVLTQNVDGLHRKAGSRNVVDIHGDVHHLLCTECRYRTTVEDYAHLPPLPRCPECEAPLRPDVVLFGELLPLDKVETIERELRRGFDVVFSIGTTSVFPYIARPVLEAKLRRKATVEVNPGETLVSGEVDVKLPMRAAEALDALWARLERG